MWAAVGNGSRPLSRREEPNASTASASAPPPDTGYSTSSSPAFGATGGLNIPLGGSMSSMVLSGLGTPAHQQLTLPQSVFHAYSPAPQSVSQGCSGADDAGDAAKVKAEPFEFPLSGSLTLATTCLLVIDCQRDFLDEAGYMHAKGYDVSGYSRPLPRIAAALYTFRVRGCRVAHARWGFRPDLADVTPYHKVRHARRGTDPVGTIGPLGKIFVRGEPGWEIHPSVAPLKGELVVDRSANSAFVGTELDKILRTWAVDKLVICGNSLDCAVHSTLRSADDLGYQNLLLSDCCGCAEDVGPVGLRDSLLAALKAEDGLHCAVAPISALMAAFGESDAAIARRIGDAQPTPVDDGGEEVGSAWPRSQKNASKLTPLSQRNRCPLPANMMTVPAIPRDQRPGTAGMRKSANPGLREPLPPRPATCEPIVGSSHAD